MQQSPSRVGGREPSRAGIPEYWIVNLVDAKVEVYREPVETSEGWLYRLVEPQGPGDQISPLSVPAATVAVSDLLP
ncbi:MAG: Uma2 family endonuclease [Candidatus Sericytochromatia bacterium]|nr:Uma2 family endonuclease [Candidatus Sericytochromatia bacterium]